MKQIRTVLRILKFYDSDPDPLSRIICSSADNRSIIFPIHPIHGILINKTFFFFPCFRFKNITGTFFHFKFFGLEVKHKKCDTGM